MKTGQDIDTETVGIISERLFLITSDLFILATKTLHCHWNMKDPRFYFLHELLDTQYHELIDNVDLVAERIRQLGKYVPANLKGFLDKARLREMETYPSGDEMIQTLVDSYDELISFMREDIELCDESHDPATSDMLTQLVRHYEKTAWILRSHLV